VKQLIVNADDFGLTAGVSRAILDAHREGIVTSTTLMANGAAFDMAVAGSRQTPSLGVGIHLNLSEGVPVSPSLKIPTLVDPRGRLHLTPSRLLKRILAQRVNLFEVELELRAQISRVLRTGISPTHLDGHKHVHVLPGVSDIVIRLAWEFSIPSVRCPLEEPPGFNNIFGDGGSSRASVLKQYLVGRGVSAFARRFRQKLAETGLQYPEHFYGLSCTGFLNTRGIREVLGRLRQGTSELMCHPGYTDADLTNTGTRLLVEREVETFALCSPLIKRLVKDSGIRLVNYRALAGSGQSEAAAA
jgi:hopanoid biosynthesis associated protein HpnK